jgi:hypothetical protein
MKIRYPNVEKATHQIERAARVRRVVTAADFNRDIRDGLNMVFRALGSPREWR